MRAATTADATVDPDEHVRRVHDAVERAQDAHQRLTGAI